MTLRNVYLSADVMAVCLQHALSIETEEIMGLLIGEVDERYKMMSIVASMTLRRSDKKPDRVEISEEQLVSATIYAEELSQKYDTHLRVLGWYHSHPHITVWPSNVDLRTQAMYQNMDSDFVGLIFSVYVKNQEGHNDIDVTCFQSVESQRKNIPLHIDEPIPRYFPIFIDSLYGIPKVFIDEENEACSKETDDVADILTKVHNDLIRELAELKILDKIKKPLLNTMQMRNKCTDIRLNALTSYRDYLTTKLWSLQK